MRKIISAGRHRADDNAYCALGRSNTWRSPPVFHRIAITMERINKVLPETIVKEYDLAFHRIFRQRLELIKAVYHDHGCFKQVTISTLAVAQGQKSD